MTEAPRQLTSIAAGVTSGLADLLAAETRRWTELDPMLGEPLGDLADLVLAGGKRIRPAYCHWGWVLGGGDPDGDGAAAAGCALELLHAFALVHDDVMDGSATRRGEPTVWRRFVDRHRRRGWRGEDRRFGEGAAVLVGDMAMVLADRTLGPVGPEVRAVWDELRAELNMGQYLDVAGTAHGRATREQARVIAEHKTAGYTIVRPLQLGAALAGRTDLAADLGEHGRPLGIAYQLRDDVIGAFGDPEVTGKPVGADLREGKPTLLLARARESATRSQLVVLDAVGASLDDRSVGAVQQILIDTGARARVEEEIDRLLHRALDALALLPEMPEALDALGALAHFAVTRDT